MNFTKLPNHVGIIMDGNRRWAKEHNKTIFEGHAFGANRIMSLAKYIFNKGIKYLSIYAFSHENLNRSKQEVDYLMTLFTKYFMTNFKELTNSNIKIIFSGRDNNLPTKLIKIMNEVSEESKNNTKGILNICFNYSGRNEIIDALNKLKAENILITEKNFSQYLYHDLPDLDLVIRTSGEQRISNFMLWQISYAELYFPKVKFPDFDEKEFDVALEEFAKRERRFGGN